MRSSWVFFKLVLYVCNYFLLVDANAMLKPTHRGVMWTRGAFNSAGYNYMGINCGGIGRVRKNDGKCGLCGDAYNGPRHHETGGKYATGAIADVIDRGERNMKVKILLNSDQGGYFEFRLCESNGTAETQACFDKHLLRVTEGRWQGDEFAYIVERAGMIHLTLEIPEKVYCTKCVLQWKYVTGNTFGRDEHGIGCLGCGHQETYINCADITIKGWEMPPTLAPVTVPTTMAWTTTTAAPTTTTPPPTTRAPATTDNKMNQLTRTKPNQNTQRTYVTKYRQPSTDYDEGSRRRGGNGNDNYYVYTPVAMPPQIPVVLSSNQKRSPAANSIPLSAKEPKAVVTETPTIPKVQSAQADNGVSASKITEPKKVTNRNIKRNVPFKIPRPPVLSNEQIDALNNNKNVLPHHDPLQKYIEVGSSRIVAAVDFTTMRAQQVQTPPTLPRNEMSKPKSTVSTLDLTPRKIPSGMIRAPKQKSPDVFSSFGDEMMGVPAVQNKRYGTNLMNEYSMISNTGVANNSLQQRGQARNHQSISGDLLSEFAFETANAVNRYPGANMNPKSTYGESSKVDRYPAANMNSKATNGDPSTVDRYPAANINSKATNGDPSTVDRYPAANINSKATNGDPSTVDRYPAANINSKATNGHPSKVDRYPAANINSKNNNGHPSTVDRYPVANMNSKNTNGDSSKVDRYPAANMNSKNTNGHPTKVDRYPAASLNSKNTYGDPSNRYNYPQNHEQLSRSGSQKSSFGDQSRRYNFPEQHKQQSANSGSHGLSGGDSNDRYNNPLKQQPGNSGYQIPSVGAPNNRNNYPQQPNPSRGGAHDSSIFNRQQEAGSEFNGKSNYPGQQTYNFNSEPNVYGGNVNSMDTNEFSQKSVYSGQISNGQFDQMPRNGKTHFGNVPKSDSSFNAFPGQNQSPYGTRDDALGKSRKTTSLPVIDTSTHRSRNSVKNNIASRFNMPLKLSPDLNAPAVPVNLFKERKQESFQAPVVFERFTNYQVGDSEHKQKVVPGNLLDVSNSKHQSINRSTNMSTAYQDLHLNADIHSPQNYFGQDHYIAHNAEISYPAFGGPGTQDLQSQQELYVGHPASQTFKNDPLNFDQQVDFNAQSKSQSYVNDPRNFGRDVAPPTQSESQSYVNDPRNFGRDVAPPAQSESQSFVNDPRNFGRDVAPPTQSKSQSYMNDPRNFGRDVAPSTQSESQSYVNDPWILGQNVAPTPKSAAQSFGNDLRNSGQHVDINTQNEQQSYVNFPFNFAQNDAANAQNPSQSDRNNLRTFGQQLVSDVYSPLQPFGSNPVGYGQHVASSDQIASHSLRNDPLNFGHNGIPHAQSALKSNKNGPMDLRQNGAPNVQSASQSVRNDPLTFGRQVTSDVYSPPQPFGNIPVNYGQDVASNVQISSPNRNDLFHFGQNAIPHAKSASQSYVNDPLNFGHDVLFNKQSESVRNDKFNFGQQMTSNAESQAQSYVNFPLNFARQDLPNEESVSRPLRNDNSNIGQHVASNGQSFKNDHFNYGLHAPENYFPQGNQDPNQAQFPLKIVSTKIKPNTKNALMHQLSGYETLSTATTSGKQTVKVTPLASTSRPVTPKTTTELTTDAIDYQMKELDNLRKKLERLQMLINQKTTGIQPKSSTTSLKQNKKRSSTVIETNEAITKELGNMFQSKFKTNKAANTPFPNDNNTQSTGFQSSKADVTDSKTNMFSPMTPSTVSPSMSKETTQYINTFKAQMLQSIKDANAKKHKSQSTHIALKTKPDVFSTKPYNTESTAYVTPRLPSTDQKPKVSSTLLTKEPTVSTQQNGENLSQPEVTKETKLQQQRELEKKNKYRQLLELILERRRQRKLNAKQQKEASDANQKKQISKPKQFDNLQPVQQQKLQHKSNVLPRQISLSEVKAQSTKRERIPQTTSLRPVVTAPKKTQDFDSRSGNNDLTVEKTSIDKLADKIAARMAEKLKSGGTNGLPGFKVVPLSSDSVMDTLRNIALNVLKDKNIQKDETGKVTDNKVIQTAKESNSQSEKTVAREMHMPQNVQKQNIIKVNTLTTKFNKNNQMPSSSRQIITTTNQSPTQNSQDKVTRRQELIKKMKEMLLKRRSAQMNNTTFGNNNRPVHLPSTRPSHLEQVEARGNHNRPVHLPSSRPSHLNQGEVRGNNNRPVHITDHPTNGRPTIYDKQTTSNKNTLPATNTRLVKKTEQIEQKRTTNSVQEVHNNQSETDKNKANVSPDIARSMLARVREMLAKKKNSEKNSKSASPQADEVMPTKDVLVKPLRKDVLFRLLQSMKKQKNSIGS